MKTYITRACGHNEKVAIYGKYDQRDAALEREKAKVCAACYAARKDEARLQAAQAAAEQAQAGGLPALQGSEKQVAWAEQIRAQAIQAVDALLAQQGDAQREDPRWAKLEAAVAALRGQAQAAWWIDHRANGADAKAWVRPFYQAG